MATFNHWKHVMTSDQTYKSRQHPNTPVRATRKRGKRLDESRDNVKKVSTGSVTKITKRDVILKLLSERRGATLQEIMDATGWQKHSARCFLAGTINRKLDLELTSSKISRRNSTPSHRD